ncbi:MAG: type II secretion system F family protein [Arachnia sp.]
MNNAFLGIVLLSLAWWVLAPDPHHQLQRLAHLPKVADGALARWVRGRTGAPALGARLLVGLAVGLAFLTFLPSPTGSVLLVATPLVAIVGGGRLSLSRPSGAVLQEELADTVELLAVCLSAGSPMPHALEVVTQVQGSETSAVLSKVTGLLAMGIPEPQAWLEIGDDDVWGAVARDVARSARSGTSLVEVLHVHADEARLVAQEKALQRARTAGVRSVIPLMACFLPAFVLVGVLPIIAGLLDSLLSP